MRGRRPSGQATSRRTRAPRSRLYTKANVQAALEAGYKERQTRTQVTAEDTVRELSRLAHADIRKFYDEQGQLIPIHLLPDDLAACIASIEIVRAQQDEWRRDDRDRSQGPVMEQAAGARAPRPASGSIPRGRSTAGGRGARVRAARRLQRSQRSLRRAVDEQTTS